MGRRIVIGSLVVGLFASPGAAQVRTRVAELSFIAGLPGEVICDVSATAAAPDRAVLGVGAYDDLAWSPDGRRLAVVWHDGSQRILDVMRPDGTKRRRISRQALSVDIGMDPAWSPDGRRLAFFTNGSLFVARADGRGRKRIVDVRGRMATVQTPTWSTRGNRIFFHRVEFGPLLREADEHPARWQRRARRRAKDRR